MGLIGIDAIGDESDCTPTYPLTVTVQGSGKVTSAPAGIDCGTVCTGNYAAATMVTLTATANANATFTGWSGACTGTSASTSVALDAVKSCTATFTEKSNSSLTVTVPGNGKVTSAPAGIDCGTDCMKNYAPGSSITLTATPNSDSLFKNWSGGCAGLSASISVRMDVAKRCIATFDKIPSSYPLAITVDGAGQVNMQGNVRNTRSTSTFCTGSYCNNNYVAGDSVILTATGSSFKGWAGTEGCTGTQPTINLVMNQNTTCSAIFGGGSCPASTVSKCPNLDTIPAISSDQPVFILGAGADSDRDQPRPFSCLKGITQTVGGSSVSMKVKGFSTYQELLDYEQKSAGGNLKVGYGALTVKAVGEVSSINFYDKQSKSRSYGHL